MMMHLAILPLRRLLLASLLLAPVLAMVLAPGRADAQPTLVELHQQIVPVRDAPPQLALTLDACSGQFDGPLIDYLIAQRIPATLFVTRRWLRRNPEAIALIRQHLDLFAIENHGARHIPAVIGAERTVYGLPVHADLAHLQREVKEGASAIEHAFGTSPRWYRGATAVYDQTAMRAIDQMGLRIAGFSLNADHGARSSSAHIVRRLQQAKPGDVIIAHMNHPESGTAAGLIDSLGSLQARGFVFVRLDQVDLRELPRHRTRRAAARPAATEVRGQAPVGPSSRVSSKE